MDQKISIIIPTYNRKMLLQRAVRSVLYQTYCNIEIIIIDDHSTDGSSELISETFANEIREGKILILKNSQNQGHPTSKNLGISHASGDYIAFLDDDDYWMPDKLELQIKKMQAEDAEACFCSTLWVEDNKFLKQTTAINKNVSFENGGPTSTWLIKKTLFKRVGLFDTTIPTNDDGELMVRINKSGTKITFVELPLYVHFYYPSTVSNSREGKISGYESILAKHKSNLNNYEISSIYLRVAILNLFSCRKKYLVIVKSIMLAPSFINTSIFFIMLLPTRFGLVVLNKLLDIKKYPKSFANRYVTS
jgi:glycosyltransferase involved in cell wall biosynthesis